MIELNYKTEQDFLNRIWSNALTEVGVNMDDAKYVIINKDGIDWVTTKNTLSENQEYVPTYTLSELILKLHEWPFNKNIENTGNENDIKSGNSGGLMFFKDAPFYCFFYKNWEITQDYGLSEYPIIAAAQLIIWCMKNGVGCVNDVSDK